MRRLYVSDVDNTLLSENYVEFSEDFKNLLIKLESNGSHFVMCSGRPTANLIELAQQLKADKVNLKYVAGYNGVEIYDLMQKKIICDNGLSYEEVDYICNILNSNGYDYMIYDTDLLRTNLPNNKWTIRESSLCKLPIGNLDKLCHSPKVLLVVEPKENEKIMSKLKVLLPEYEIFDSMTCFIEIQKKEINKATALKFIQKIENIKLENTYGFGDGGNDLELLKQAGCGVAVSNAKEEVKNEADVVIGHVDDDSVFKFIKEIESK